MLTLFQSALRILKSFSFTATFLIGESFFDNVCEEFNKKFETYTTGDFIGFIDLSNELKNYIQNEVEND